MTTPKSKVPTILVVDDEPNITELVSMAIRFAGYEAVVAATGRQALAIIERQPVHLAILDVMLPGIDGFEVARRLRDTTNTGARLPVLFLTARDAPADRLNGFDLGGDDYVTKPFSVQELIARVTAILRRSGALTASNTTLEVADLILDESTRDVTRDGALIELTATEYRLLRYLMANARRVMTREQILDQVWDYNFEGANGSGLDTYISYLRRKIDNGHSPLIHTVRGVGYTIREARETS